MAGADEPLLPGMYGNCTPNMTALEDGGMGDQITGTPSACVPDPASLREWVEGTMGVQFTGGKRFLGGWFPTRSCMIKWDGPRRRLTRKSSVEYDWFFYRAGDQGIFDFSRGNACFCAVRFRGLLRSAVHAAVDVARMHVTTPVAAYAWVSHVISKEIDQSSRELRDMCHAHGIDLEDMYSYAQDRVTSVYQTPLLY